MLAQGNNGSSLPPPLRRLMEDPALADRIASLEVDQVLFGPRDQPRYLYLIVSGLVRLTEAANRGRLLPRTLLWLGPGNFLGFSAVPGNEPDDISAVAMRPTRVLPLSVEQLRIRIERDPELGLEIINQLGGRLRTAQHELDEQVRLEAPQRLARTLHRLAEIPELAQREGAWEVIRLTHADLASRTGISRETVSLILSRWRREGAVRTGRRRLEINPQRLAEVLKNN
ncbi:MAG: Transcriptional regulator SdrP [Phycisphaerae bacterium]|nr:Transcriptional regulator SdrP [Phycisphaerae bacterium]